MRAISAAVQDPMSFASNRVVFRTDASVAIGLGHLKRSLALAQAMRAIGAEVAFVVAHSDVDPAAIVRAAAFHCWTICHDSGDVDTKTAPDQFDRRGVNQIGDAQTSVDLLREWQPQWVVVDHYGIDARWHNLVRTELGCKIAAIDDLADRSLAVDLLIDQNLHDDHKQKYRGKLERAARLLGGPRYAMLGASYSNGVRYKFGEQVRSVGVFLGGTDPHNYSSTVVQACREHAKFDGPIEVVSTASSPHLKRLLNICETDSKIKLSIDLPDLSEFFAAHDIQIGAGGGANWERCCVGVPTLLLAYAANQRVVVDEMIKLGGAIAPASLDPEAIGATLSDLILSSECRRGLIEQSTKLVDGLGAQRVALTMLAGRLNVRPADTSDSDLIYRWRNSPEVRKVSRSNAPIDWADHCEWLLRSLANPDRLVLIGQIGSVTVGVIRFDREAECAEVSLYLDPAMIGTGIGHYLLAAGEKYAAGAWTCVTDFRAEALEDNVGSQRLFESAGYMGNWHEFRKSIRLATGKPNRQSNSAKV